MTPAEFLRQQYGPNRAKVFRPVRTDKIATTSGVQSVFDINSAWVIVARQTIPRPVVGGGELFADMPPWVWHFPEEERAEFRRLVDAGQVLTVHRRDENETVMLAKLASRRNAVLRRLR